MRAVDQEVRQGYPMVIARSSLPLPVVRPPSYASAEIMEASRIRWEGADFDHAARRILLS